MLQGKWTGGGHVFFAQYSCYLSYIFIKKILFYYNFCQKWLDLPIQIAFFSRLSLPSQNPKQQTVE